MKVQHEMSWVVAGFKARADMWRSRAAKEEGNMGLQAYANKQCALWRTFAEQADMRFKQGKAKYLAKHPDCLETLLE
jgi:hypothetical protein